MDSAVIVLLVFVLITAVVSALVAFVVVPSLSESREEGENVNQLTIADYVTDINAANRSGYDRDLVQDNRIDALEENIQSTTESSAAPFASAADEVRFNDFLSDSGIEQIMASGDISTPSEGEGALENVLADVDFSGILNSVNSAVENEQVQENIASMIDQIFEGAGEETESGGAAIESATETGNTASTFAVEPVTGLSARKMWY
nr:hypothetical protein TetV2_00481 [Oceanusvirus sp.]